MMVPEGSEIFPAVGLVPEDDLLTSSQQALPSAKLWDTARHADGIVHVCHEVKSRPPSADLLAQIRQTFRYPVRPTHLGRPRHGRQREVCPLGRSEQAAQIAGSKLPARHQERPPLARFPTP